MYINTATRSLGGPQPSHRNGASATTSQAVGGSVWQHGWTESNPTDRTAFKRRNRCRSEQHWRKKASVAAQSQHQI